MTQQEPSTPDELLNELKDTSVGDLSKGVAKEEGVNGSLLKPVYSHRQIKCFTITDSELQQIGLANIGITGLASIGSAFFAFWLDIFKDTLLSQSVPENAKIVLSYVQPLCLIMACTLWIFATVIYFWRKRMIDTLKRESLS